MPARDRNRGHFFVRFYIAWHPTLSTVFLLVARIRASVYLNTKFLAVRAGTLRNKTSAIKLSGCLTKPSMSATYMPRTSANNGAHASTPTRQGKSTKNHSSKPYIHTYVRTHARTMGNRRRAEVSHEHEVGGGLRVLEPLEQRLHLFHHLQSRAWCAKRSRGATRSSRKIKVGTCTTWRKSRYTYFFEGSKAYDFNQRSFVLLI